MHFLDFKILSLETRNQSKKNGNVVRTSIDLNPTHVMLEIIQFNRQKLNM